MANKYLVAILESENICWRYQTKVCSCMAQAGQRGFLASLARAGAIMRMSSRGEARAWRKTCVLRGTGKVGRRRELRRQQQLAGRWPRARSALMGGCGELHCWRRQTSRNSSWWLQGTSWTRMWDPCALSSGCTWAPTTGATEGMRASLKSRNGGGAIDPDPYNLKLLVSPQRGLARFFPSRS